MTLRPLLVLATAGFVGCAATPPTERLVLELPADADVWWFTASADDRAAWAERRGSDAFLHVAGRLDGPFP